MVMKRIIPLALGLGLATTVQAADIKFDSDMTVTPDIGHTTHYETFKITVENGDSLSSIARQLSDRDLGHNYVCGSRDATVNDLLRWNDWIDNRDLIHPGQELVYTRVANQYRGFHVNI
jgi:hypothetical protein